jgi:hypothetical protein
MRWRPWNASRCCPEISLLSEHFVPEISFLSEHVVLEYPISLTFVLEYFYWLNFCTGSGISPYCPNILCCKYSLLAELCAQVLSWNIPADCEYFVLEYPYCSNILYWNILTD